MDEVINYNDFKMYIDNINTKNIKNIKKLYKNIILKIILYFNNIYYFDIILNKLKVPNSFKTFYNEESNIIENVLCYAPNTLRDRISLNTYDSTTRITRTSSFHETFLHTLLNDENYLNTILQNYMINDNILAKILYFYYITFKPIQNNGSGGGLKLSTTLEDHHKYLFIDIIEYQFYLCHILRKKMSNISDTFSLNDNYYKAAVFFKKFCPNTYDVLFSFYNSTINTNIDNSLIQFKKENNNKFFIKSNDSRNIDYRYKVFNIAKIIFFINNQDQFITTNSIKITDVELPFITCYRKISILANHFTNFYFLNNNTILEGEIYNNILCIYDYSNVVTYHTSSVNNINQKKIKFKNIFICMPYVLFYYYKAILPTNLGNNTSPENIGKFLNICSNVFQVYKYLIENDLLHDSSTNFTIEEYIYKINKILYKTIKQLYKDNKDIINNNNEFSSKINIINELKKDLVNNIYSSKGINIEKEKNYYNYIHGLIPNYNEPVKEQVYGAIDEENRVVRRAINYLKERYENNEELRQMNLLQTRLQPKYEMLKRRENNLNIQNIPNDLFGKHNDNHVFFRKLFNNNRLRLNHPLKKYYNSFYKKKI